MAELGCGVYEVFLFNRGGTDLIDTLTWTAISWGRKLDDTSEAQVATVLSDDCCESLADARPWLNEIAIYRDGTLAWVGPMFKLQSTPEAPVITARDLTVWWYHRRVHNDHVYTATDLATIFEALAEDAMAPDNTPNIVLVTSPSGVLSDYSVLALQHKKAGPLLRDLSAAGIDWTVVGRNVITGGQTINTAPLGPFIDTYFDVPPTVTLDGSTETNDWIVSGAGGGELGDAVFGEAQDMDAVTRDGLLEDEASMTTVLDDTTATAAASSRLQLSAEVLTVEAATLQPQAPFDISQLIPGTLCQLSFRGTCLKVEGFYRLQEVRVSADSSGGEQVQVAFQPAGST